MALGVLTKLVKYVDKLISLTGSAASVNLAATLPNGQVGTVQQALDDIAGRDFLVSTYTKNGTVTDTNAAKNAISAATSVKGNVVFDIPITLDSTLYVPMGVGLLHAGGISTITLSATGVFDDGWAIVVNSLDRASWVMPYPNFRGGVIGNFEFRNDAGTANRRGILYFGSAKIGEIRGYKMDQLIVRPSGTYCDNFEIDRVYCEPVQGTDPQVDIRGLGDGLKIGSLHFPYNPVNPGDGTPFALRVTGALGGRIGECIGGNYHFKQCKVAVENAHIERAQVTIEDAHVDISHSVIAASNKLPIILLGSGGHTYAFNMNSVEFLYTEGLLQWQGADLRIHGNYMVTVKNSYRKFSKNGNLSVSQMQGIKVEGSGGTPLTEWNKHSSILSRNGIIMPGAVVNKDFLVASTSNGFPGISAASTDSNTTWGLATGTYYYAVQLLLDTTRLIGRNNSGGEKSIALTGGGSGSRLDLDYNNRLQVGILRLYRGSVTGSYDKTVDIPIYNLSRLYDNGIAVNGNPWVSRTAGAIDVINSGMGESAVRFEGERVSIDAATIPTTGTWPASDDIRRTPPLAGGKRNWTCVTGNATGGVWKAEGTIDA